MCEGVREGVNERVSERAGKWTGWEWKNPGECFFPMHNKEAHTKYMTVSIVRYSTKMSDNLDQPHTYETTRRNPKIHVLHRVIVKC